MGWRVFALHFRSSGDWEKSLLIVSFGLRIAIDDHVAQEIEQLSGAIAAGLEFQQFGSRINQGGSCQACAESLVCDDIFQKGNVRFHAADAEFAQGAVHSLQSQWECAPKGCDL